MKKLVLGALVISGVLVALSLLWRSPVQGYNGLYNQGWPWTYRETLDNSKVKSGEVSPYLCDGIDSLSGPPTNTLCGLPGGSFDRWHFAGDLLLSVASGTLLGFAASKLSKRRPRR
jgi:hypothetical protein